MSLSERPRWWERAYARLLGAYPGTFRERFGPDMRRTFAAEAELARRRGRGAFAAFLVRSLGHVVSYGLAERLGSMRPTPSWTDGVASDAYYAARRLVRAPGFTLTAAVTLALGIGGTTAIATLVRSVVVQPLPYPEADRLVSIQHTAEGAGLPLIGLSHGTYWHYREHGRALEEITVYRTRLLTLLDTQGAARIEGVGVTRGFFEIFLEGAPVRGRALDDADQVPGAARVAVISHELWTTRFGGREDVVGRSLSLDANPTEIVGVLPPEFDVPSPRTQVWVPERLDPAELYLGGFGRSGVGRLRPGATVEQAGEDLVGLVPSLDRYNPVAFDLLVTGGGLTPIVRPLEDVVVGDIEQTLWILLATVLFVLGIACANVANLFLVRADGQRQEVAVRVALGAGRARILRHHLSESFLLAALGGLASFWLATAAVRTLVATGPDAVPRLHEVSVGGWSILVTASLTVIAGVLFGFVPLWRQRGSAGSGSLHDGGRGSAVGGRRRRAREMLVVAQLSLALVLMVGAGLMVRSFLHLRSVDPGLESESALVFHVGLPPALYPDPTEAFRFHQAVLEEVRSLPGVAAVGATVCLPLHPCDGLTPVYVDGAPAVQGETPPSVDLRGTTSGFFQAAGIPLIEGRALEPGDAFRRPASAVISRGMAERLWPGRSALGRRIHPDWPDQEPYTVVGVVEDVRALGVARAAPDMMYLSFLGTYAYVAPPHTLTFVVRTTVDPLSLAPAVRSALGGLDPNVPVADLRELREVVGDATGPAAFAATLLVVAGLVALLLGTVGVYGVLSYVVSERRAEIGVRLAMGAEAGQVQRLVIGQGARVGVIGLAVGLVGAVVLTRSMRAVLYGVTPLDGVTYIGVTAGLLLVVLIASWLPARRAAGVDPVEALRSG